MRLYPSFATREELTTEVGNLTADFDIDSVGMCIAGYYSWRCWNNELRFGDPEDREEWAKPSFTL